MQTTRLAGHDPGPLTGSGSNGWLIHGRIPTLIDTGSGRQEFLDALEAALADRGETLEQVLVTHAHPDHAGGCDAIARRWPDVRFVKYPWPGRDERYATRWQPVGDDDLLDAGNGQLWAIHTPGHSPDHLCFFETRTSTLIAGDLVINGSTVVIPFSMEGSLAQYMASLRRVVDLRPRRILPGHGDAIEEPLGLLRGYIAHRLARERQIIEALEKQPLTVPALVPRVYADLADHLVRAAGESVLAHLIKLRDENRARVEPHDDAPGGIWSLTH
jgi:glyoxylase-like metal-dependent hydrolase (beta-lactamase superfamily II)